MAYGLLPYQPVLRANPENACRRRWLRASSCATDIAPVKTHNRDRQHAVLSAVCLALFFTFRIANALAFGDAQPAKHDNEDIIHNRGPHERLLSIAVNPTVPARPETPAIRPDDPLTRAIHRGMSARSIAGLRTAEAGRQLLHKGDYARALMRFERALALEPNPINYYYLGVVHYRLAHYQQALEFLEVAESHLNGQAEWPAELAALTATVRDALHSARISERKRDVAAIRRPIAAVTEAEPHQQSDTTVFGEPAGFLKRRYLLAFDLFVLSCTVLIFFAAFLASSLRSLRPTEE